jgi:hypothetical protein
MEQYIANLSKSVSHETIDREMGEASSHEN